jgi:hypothetical protein
MAASDGPVFDPGAAFFADEFIGHAVGGIHKSVVEGDEFVAAFAQEIEEFGEMIGLQPGGVNEQDLFGFVADEIAGEFFGVVEFVVGVSQVSIGEFAFEGGVVAFVGVGIDAIEHPVPGVHGDGCDAITAGNEEGLGFASSLQVAAGFEIGMAEIAEGHAVLSEKNFGDGFAADGVFFPFR